MSEPRRLLDGGGSDLELELLRSAEADVPSPRARQKALVALGIGTGLVGAGMTAASSTVATGGGVLKWIGIGVVSGGLVVGGAQQAMHLAMPHVSIAVKGQERAATEVSAPVVAMAKRLRGSAQQRPALEPVVAPPAEPANEEADEAPAFTEAKAAAVPLAAHPSMRKGAPRLADEVAELDRAREALAKGDSARALDALEQHDKQFGTALLGPEAMVLRMEALAQSGDRAGAAALANQFLAAYPTSAHSNRVRSILAKSVSGPSSQ